MSQKFIELFREQQEVNFQINKDHGFEEDNDFNFGEKIALMHSELSEALEAFRHNDPPSEHIIEFTSIEEEFADTIIRIMNVSERLNLRTVEAMFAKQTFNAGRPYKHGGKRI